MDILKNYMKQLEEDKANEDNSFIEGSQLSEEHKEEYIDKLNELRNDPNDMLNAHKKMVDDMKKITETDTIIKEEEVDRILVKHAYCEDCGEELISEAPAMFNPFTFERICKHKCTKCGKLYNLEFAYPRLVFINNKGEEIPAYTR